MNDDAKNDDATNDEATNDEAMNDAAVDGRDAGDDARPFEDDEIMTRVSTPPEFPPASRERVEQTWSAIVAHIEENEVPQAAKTRPAFGVRWVNRLVSRLPAAPAGSWQLAKVAALIVIGFGAAWIGARQGWLPGTDPTDAVSTLTDVDAGPDRTWLAADDYGSRLEALLLGVTAGDSSASAAVVPTAREVSRGLLNDNRRYQRVAERKGDPALSELLSRMEIILLALATAPEGQEQEVIDALREFIDERDVLGDLREVRSSVPRIPRPRAVTTGS